MKGRRPYPTAVHELRGNPGKRPLPADEPKPDSVDSAAAPAWLHGDARDVWNALAPELRRLGLLTKLDVPMLASACRWWAVYRAADRKLQRGITRANVKAHKGDTEQRRAVAELSIALRAHEAALNVFSRFGVTPSDRTRLHAPQPKGHGDDASGRSTDPHDELARRRAERREREQHPAATS